MKKLSFFLMMCLIGLVYPSYAQIELPVIIGSGETSSTVLPTEETFKYSVTQQIFTAEEMSATPGAITSVAFKMANTSNVTRTFDIYMINTDKEQFTYTEDWVNLSSDALVFSGQVTYPGEEGAWFTINFQEPFEYTGGNVLLCVYDKSNFFETYADDGRFYTYSTGSSPRSLNKYSIQYNYNVTDLKDEIYGNYEGSNPYYNNQVKFSLIVDDVNNPITIFPDPINLGERPSGAWMRPVEVKIASNVASINISSIESSNSYFTLHDTETPAEVVYGFPMTIGVSHGQGTGAKNGQLTITYDNNETEVVEMSATAYNPVAPDVWEMAEEAVSPHLATPTYSTLRNNYSLPFDGTDGVDAVYKLNISEDALLTATSTGNNGKVVLYHEDFNGKGGPDTDNYYQLQTSPVITDMFVPAGTYYLVASATSPFMVYIETKDAPAPSKAFNPNPADGATKVNNSTLSWVFGANTVEYQLLVDTQNPPQQVAVDWTNDLQAEYDMGELTVNTAYYWQVNSRNATATTNGDVWSFSTSYDAPFIVIASSKQIYEGEPVTLYWDAVNACDGYNVYCNGSRINDEVVTALEYTVDDLTYNMGGYTFTVVSVYGENESEHSIGTVVYVSGMADVTGKIFEVDGISAVSGGNVVFKGVDEFDRDRSFTFNVNNNGTYSGEVFVGHYTIASTADDYQIASLQADVVYGVTNTFDFMMYETYYPVSEVVATKHDNSSVTVEWDMDRALTGYNVYRQNIHLDDAKLIDSDLTSTSYTDDEWYNSGAGVYKWGVASVYEGNRVQKVILEEDFEGGSMPEGWITYQEPQSEYFVSDWGVKTNSNNYNYFPHQGEYAAFSAGSPSTSSYYMVTPSYDLSLCTNVSLKFHYITPRWGDVCTLTIGVSSSPDGPWTHVWSSNATDVPSWTEVEIDMTEYNMKKTYIAFINENKYGFCVGVDDILLTTVSNESDIIWSNGIDNDMSTTMTVSAKTNSEDPVVGTVINFKNLVESEYNFSATIGDGDSYTWDNFRKGKYRLTVSKAGFASDNDGVVYDIWEPTEIECLLTEILYSVENLYVSPTGWMKWDNNDSRELVSYEIKVNGVSQGTVTTPYHQLDLNKYPYEEGKVYTATVVANYSSGSSASVKYSWTYSECDEFETVTDFEVNNVDGKNVLSWTLPEVDNENESDGNYMQYDDMTNVDAGGMFHPGSFYWAIMFPSEALAPYVGQKLLKVSTFDFAAHNGELSIYLGGTSAPLNLVHSQPYACSGSKDYIEFDLTKSIAIGNDNIWIVFYNYNGQYVAPAGVNTGDPNGRWISVDGIQWYDVYLDTGYDFTWNIRAYLNYEGEYPGMEKDIIGTMIYRDGELITAEPVEATSFTDNISDGAEYSVRVVHGGLPNVSYYAMSCLTDPIAVDENYDEMTSVYPNPVKDNLTINADNMRRITIINTMGQVVYDHEVKSDSEEINMSQYESGVYMVRITTDNGMTTQRVTVVK